MERRGYVDGGCEISVDDSGRRTLRKRGRSGGLRHFSLGTTAAFAFARQDGGIRRGRGGAGSPPFPAGARAAGVATPGGRRAGAVDDGKLCGDSRRSGRRPAPLTLVLPPPPPTVHTSSP